MSERPTANHSGPTSELLISASTNQIISAGYGYDATSGNQTSMPGPGPNCQMTLTYDAWNRLVNVYANSCGGEKYGYGPDGRRVWKKTRATGTWTNAKEWVSLYGVEGNLLGTYLLDASGSGIDFSFGTSYTYFGKKRVWVNAYMQQAEDFENTAVFEDRLGSAVWRSGTKTGYYPYGEERAPGTAPERMKFGTYYRDGVTGLDYAQQRYYSSVAGRFVTVDPYVSSGGVAEPQGWNRYAYVQNDPINYKDPHGLFACSVGVGEGQEVTDCEIQVIAFPEPNPESLPRESRRLKVKTQRVVAQLITIRKTIDSDCLSWLKSGIAGGLTNVFNDYYNALIGADGDPPLAGAGDFIGTDYQNLNAIRGFFGSGYYITVNTSGAFFTPLAGVGYGNKYSAQIESIAPATSEARNFILLHELAHYFEAPGFTSDDGYSKGRQRQNNDLLWEKCQKTIKGISGPI